MTTDITGHQVALTGDALAAWNATILGVLSHHARTPEHLARTLDLAPDCALAHALRGLLLLSLARSEMTAIARLEWEEASKLGTTDPRTISFVGALGQWLSGRPADAAATLDFAASSGDILAFKLAHAIRFMIGAAGAMRRSAQAMCAAIDDSHVLAGYVHGCHAFSLEETGDYPAAERAGRRAVALAPDDVWGRHAVAHVLEMSGRVHEGILWLSDRNRWSHANNFRFHMSWHLALFHLERGDVETVLSIYDSEIRNEPTDDFRDIANGASLLGRLTFEGIDVGERWDELAEIAGRRTQDRQLAFADLHYLLALAGAGRPERAFEIAMHLAGPAPAGSGNEVDTARRNAARTARGMLAFFAGKYAEAAHLLGSCRPALVSIGGSNAQRDVFEQLYIESLIRSDAYDEARAVLTQRLATRPQNDFALRRLQRFGRVRNDRSAVGALLGAAVHAPVRE